MRTFFHRRRALAMWLVALALLSKALVPPGYMPGRNGARSFDVIVCSDPSGPVTQTIIIPFGEEGHKQSGDQPGKASCLFSALTHGAGMASDPAIPIEAIAILLVRGLSATADLPLRREAHLRPPLRGPPAAV